MPSSLDFNDIYLSHGKEVVLQQLQGNVKLANEDHQHLRVISGTDLCTMILPPRVDFLSPIIQSGSVSMIYAKRGVGKTHVALGIAAALASGSNFLRWSVPEPKNVLYLDGEMPIQSMQQRLRSIEKIIPKENMGRLQVINCDLQPHGMPDLSSLEGQKAFQPYVDLADVIIVDNLSTLVRSGKENEGESWVPLQNWAIAQRGKGKAVIFIHHAGKSGQQRGSSRREDAMDLVLELRHPTDYDPDQNARFEVHFKKARHLIGDDSKSFEAWLQDGQWQERDITDLNTERVMELHKIGGMSVRDIFEETGIPKSTVARIIQKHK